MYPIDDAGGLDCRKGFTAVEQILKFQPNALSGIKHCSQSIKVKRKKRKKKLCSILLLLRIPAQLHLPVHHPNQPANQHATRTNMAKPTGFLPCLKAPTFTICDFPRDYSGGIPQEPPSGYMMLVLNLRPCDSLLLNLTICDRWESRQRDRGRRTGWLPSKIP